MGESLEGFLGIKIDPSQQRKIEGNDFILIKKGIDKDAVLMFEKYKTKAYPSLPETSTRDLLDRPLDIVDYLASILKVPQQINREEVDKKTLFEYDFFAVLEEAAAEHLTYIQSLSKELGVESKVQYKRAVNRIFGIPIKRINEEVDLSVKYTYQKLLDFITSDDQTSWGIDFITRYQLWSFTYFMNSFFNEIDKTTRLTSNYAMHQMKIFIEELMTTLSANRPPKTARELAQLEQNLRFGVPDDMLPGLNYGDGATLPPARTRHQKGRQAGCLRGKIK